MKDFYGIDLLNKHKGVYNLHLTEISCHDFQWNIPKKDIIFWTFLLWSYNKSKALKHYKNTREINCVNKLLIKKIE